MVKRSPRSGERRRSSAFKPKYNIPGSRPGVSTAQQSPAQTTFWLFDIEKAAVLEDRAASIELCKSRIESDSMTWIHFQGTPDAAMLHDMADAYGLHTLAVEDVVNHGQRSKLDPYDNQLFAVLQWPVADQGHFRIMQISLFLGADYVVSFCEGDQDPFEPIRARVRAEPPGLIRQQGADFLFYALIDLIVDLSFPVLEDISEQLEELEERVIQNPEPPLLEQIHQIKRNLIILRKSLWPQREVVSTLSREDHPLIQSRTRLYLRDSYDHAIRVLDFIESYKEMVSGLHDLYLSSISNRMNDIMKVLTIIATIFIPLSFFTGLYGMNFNTSISPWNMPELNLRYGYPVFVGLLLVVAIGMLIFFRRRRWI